MLSVTAASGFGGGVAAAVATRSFEAAVVDTSAATTYTFSSVALGTAAAGRKIVVAVNKSGGTGGDLVQTLTVAGDSAANILQIDGGGGKSAELWQVELASGTSGDIVLAWNTTENHTGIGVWAVYGAATSVTDTASSTANDVLTGDIDIPAGGLCIGTAGGSYGGTFTWTQLTEHYDATIEASVVHTGASAEFAAEQSGLTITCDGTASGAELAMALASWGPL